jgi:hypothetical protein
MWVLSEIKTLRIETYIQLLNVINNRFSVTVLDSRASSSRLPPASPLLQVLLSSYIALFIQPLTEPLERVSL